ncbi:hypothetical protein HPB50_018793 [Hyalomma asiaticum]|uniref:Uncharacterized protein n=1 Tax=Hyalomma asiaticum TaxID=266040 RepID=A0ACB7RJH6_HYAAI|nr:hypothetical protein HPB50_018793 [Hyalomma asiaticum]
MPSPPPYQGTVEELDQPCALALATASKGYASDLRFLAPTELTNGTPAAATYTRKQGTGGVMVRQERSPVDTGHRCIRISAAAAPARGYGAGWELARKVDGGAEVARFVAGVPGCERYAKKFRDRKIDSNALFRMKEHLTTVMNMNLGPALKLCATIDSQ